VRQDNPRHVPDSKTCRGRFRHYRRRSLKTICPPRARVWLEDRREHAYSLSRPLVSTPALHRVRQMPVPDEWSDDLTDLDDEVDELEDEQPVASTSKSAAKAAKGAGKQSLRPPRTVSYSAQSLFGTLSPHHPRSVVLVLTSVCPNEEWIQEGSLDLEPEYQRGASTQPVLSFEAYSYDLAHRCGVDGEEARHAHRFRPPQLLRPSRESRSRMRRLSYIASVRSSLVRLLIPIAVSVASPKLLSLAIRIQKDSSERRTCIDGKQRLTSIVQCVNITSLSLWHVR
jgi:hypothetical protein